MSRVAKNPVRLPAGVEVSLNGAELTVKGKKGVLSRCIPAGVPVSIEGNEVIVTADKSNQKLNALAGTTRANIANMVTGVSTGFETKLTLVGVGYRAAAKGDTLSLTLGFSHPVEYRPPAGIEIETPSQTDIIVRGCDRQQVGQVAANIRAYRPPEPYKGKGVRYSDEQIVRKEAKKK
jgi:large subunit ribosomal protein L6